MATMDGKTLFSTGKQIQKAIESGDSGESLLNILQPLTKWTATEDLLRQSKIGVIVSKLRQQKDPKVVEQASKLVNKWKQDVNASRRQPAAVPHQAPQQRSRTLLQMGRAALLAARHPQLLR
jgi:transcription elongation factor S-II